MTPDPNAASSPFSGGESYERFMGRWSRRLAPLFVRFAGVEPGERILDVGAGTGALSLAVASVHDTRVTGVDASPAYVAWATSRGQSERVAFEVGDARHLPMDTGVFDRCLSMLALNFVPDLEAAVGEMARVTRSGGMVAAAVWDYGDGMEILRAFWDEAVAQRASSDARDERHMPCCQQGQLASLWRRSGLLDVVEEALTVETRFVSFDDYWGPFTEGQGPAGAFVAGLPPDQRSDLESRMRRRLRPGSDGPFSLRARAWAVRGITSGVRS